MRTIRRRLTAGYAVALLACLGLFGAALYLELGKPSERELDQRLTLQADLAGSWLTESHRVLGALVVPGQPPSLDPGVSAYFEGFRDYLVLSDPQGQILFLSAAARALRFEELQRLSASLRPSPRAPRADQVALSDSLGEVRVLTRPITTAGVEVGALLVGTPITPVAADPSIVLRAMFVVSPLVILAAVLLGYLLAGNALRPLEGIIDEVEAITDGRSLHRRIVVPRSSDELARLAVTVNGMLARLEQSFASLRRFTADASHELKTPLMVLRAHVERALTDERTAPEILTELDEALEELNWMSEMVENLLTLARADEGRAPLAVERSDLRDLVAEAAETAGILGEPAQVAVTSAMPPHPVLAEIDRHRIRELLLNLVTNAIKYTPAGGSVELSLADDEDEAVVTVRDTGIGIAAGDLPHVFERFWRADVARSRTGERSGTGLGLAITKWIAEAHGGTITVQSRPRRGTTFTVTLPKPVAVAGAESGAAPDPEGVA